jgi:hypothetical protein
MTVIHSKASTLGNSGDEVDDSVGNDGNKGDSGDGDNGNVDVHTDDNNQGLRNMAEQVVAFGLSNSCVSLPSPRTDSILFNIQKKGH